MVAYLVPEWRGAFLGDKITGPCISAFRATPAVKKQEFCAKPGWILHDDFNYGHSTFCGESRCWIVSQALVL